MSICPGAGRAVHGVAKHGAIHPDVGAAPTRRPLNAGRRQVLALAAATLAGGWAGAVRAAVPSAQETVAAFSAGRVAQSDGLHVELPTLADNANAVPVAIRIDGEASSASYCEELIIVAERNPRPLACRFRFTPLMGAADVATRIRLAESQAVVVLARMSDGRLLQARREITVAAGGCGG